jgi:hypothetical protein
LSKPESTLLFNSELSPKLKIQYFKIKKLSDFRRFSIPRSEKKESKNLQISVLGFQIVIMRIEKVE